MRGFAPLLMQREGAGRGDVVGQGRRGERAGREVVSCLASGRCACERAAFWVLVVIG